MIIAATIFYIGERGNEHRQDVAPLWPKHVRGGTFDIVICFFRNGTQEMLTPEQVQGVVARWEKSFVSVEKSTAQQPMLRLRCDAYNQDRLAYEACEAARVVTEVFRREDGEPIDVMLCPLRRPVYWDLPI